MSPEFSAGEAGGVVKNCPFRKSKTDYWIEIELIGEDDRPIPWEEYRVEFKQADPVRGLLDGCGWARIENIVEPGPYQVVFPNVDKEAAEYKGTAGQREGGCPKNWIEIELIGEDGQGIGYERFLVKRSAGDPIAGCLDANGFVRLEGLEDPGPYEVSFPQLDREAVEPVNGDSSEE